MCLFFFVIQCRLEMLALLVESKKSTLRFTRKELDMILLFLSYNLCEKMEYVPFIKKVTRNIDIDPQNLTQIEIIVFYRL